LKASSFFFQAKKPYHLKLVAKSPSNSTKKVIMWFLMASLLEEERTYYGLGHHRSTDSKAEQLCAHAVHKRRFNTQVSPKKDKPSPIIVYRYGKQMVKSIFFC
jgi:hypothetical protein